MVAQRSPAGQRGISTLGCIGSRSSLPPALRWAFFRSAAVPVVGLAAFALLPFRGAFWPLTASAGGLAVLLVLPLTARQVTRIETSPHPMAEAIAAVTTVATVVLVGFAAGYFSLAVHTEQMAGIETKVDAFYFTVITLGTVGFGDIVPVGQGARTLVAVQILFNLTVLGLSVRWITRATTDRRRAAEDA
jgi:voltage-gated potassium channel